MVIETLLASVNRRIEAYRVHQDASAVLAEGALEDANRLWQEAWAASPDGGIPANVAVAVAMLHWSRHEALPDGADHGEGCQLAADIFAAILPAAAELVPADVRRQLSREGGPTPDTYEHRVNQVFAIATHAHEVLESAVQLDDDAAFEHAIALLRRGLAASPDDNPVKAMCLSYLGEALQTRFERAGNLADLDESIEARWAAASAFAEDHKFYASMQSALYHALQTRFEQLGEPSDLDNAIQAIRAAAGAQPGEPGYLGNLGNSLRARFELAGNLVDLDEAIQAGRAALDAAHESDFSRAMVWSNQCNALRLRFQYVGSLMDLDEAILMGRAAVEAEPGSVTCLTNLGLALLARYEQLGEWSDLDESIQLCRAAVQAEPGEASAISNLSIALYRRHLRTGELKDLDEAIAAIRVAVASEPQGQRAHAAYLSNLDGYLQARFRLTEDLADLDEAVGVSRKALDALPGGDPRHAVYQSNLANALQARFERLGRLEDIDEAIRRGLAAMKETPEGDPRRPSLIVNVGSALNARFDSTGRLEDIDEAVRLGYAAVQAAPPGDVGQWGGLNNVGIALQARFDRTGQTKDAVAALEAWQRTAAMATAPVSYRIPAARSWGQMAARLGRWRDATEAHSTAVGLLPLLTWQGVSRASREQLLNSCARLAADAAACAIAARQPQRAVELLEQGRAVLWSQLLDTRTDLAELHDAAPVLAARVEEVRSALDHPDPSPGSGSVTVTADDRMALARQWDDLIAQVRALPDFTEFARPPHAATLTKAVTGGTVIIVNVSLWRCDALLITADRIRVVPLPGLTVEAGVGCAIKYLNALLRFEEARGDPKTARDELEQELTEVLEWLWDVIAEPVLTACGLTSAPDGAVRSRVWWCPTGPLALLPLHAAGHHDPADLLAGRNVLDRVISSYTPTLRALSRSQVRPVTDRPDHMLLIALPDTPGQPALPYVTEEQALLSSIFTDAQCTDLAGAAATRGAIMEGLAAHNWAHIACHGTQNLGDPSTGGLIPYDWLTEGFVTVTDIRAGSANGDFVFLSACKTATTGITNLDEIITLAAGLHYTGWRHVIATLWSIWDNAAADISRELYPRLVHQGSLDPANAAEALHHAVHQCRARHPRRPSEWAPFIHIGP